MYRNDTHWERHERLPALAADMSTCRDIPTCRPQFSPIHPHQQAREQLGDTVHARYCTIPCICKVARGMMLRLVLDVLDGVEGGGWRKQIGRVETAEF